jgi:tRNA (guanine10-N2)-dimethyltransferase
LTNRSLVLLSGEDSTIPAAEARALFLAYDPASTFEQPHARVLIADSRADPHRVARRIAYARRVGPLLDRAGEASGLVKGRPVRVKSFSLGEGGGEVEPGGVLEGIDATVDLKRPEYEFTVVSGNGTLLALTRPLAMAQGWSLRRPRKRPFFHPSAIFPKLARALVNLSRCREGGVLIDPFAGTGSIPMEAYESGLRPVALDMARKMVSGSSLNMRAFRQRWLGVVRGDAARMPFAGADCVVTDVPYGRASTTGGAKTADLMSALFGQSARVLSPGSFLVVMHPDTVEASSDYFELAEVHRIYVHKKLTRAVSVLRRK